MNVYLHIHQVKQKNHIELHDSIRYLYPKKNTIMNGDFTKILFSINNVTMNGLYLFIPFKVHDMNDNNHIRYLQTNNTQNIQLKQDLQNIEEQLLKNYMDYNRVKKKCDHILMNQLVTNQIRVYRNHDRKTSNRYVIKISGIWETRDKIGITYKILEL